MKRTGGLVAAVLLASVLVLVARPDATAVAPALPPRLPPAAYVPEPALPVPAGWAFPEAFPRTSGTSRLSGGALYWSDFLYDDHGAVGNPMAGQAAYGTYGTPSGSYTYPDGSALNNGADIFRVGIGRHATSTVWRIDWNTLVDPDVPIAAFGIDRDDDAATGSAEWPGVAGLASPGIEQVLLVSSRGAWLADATGRGGDAQQVAALGRGLVVDMNARSFVVEIPDAALAPQGVWKVRLATGLADSTGKAFAEVPFDHGALPGQPPVYNVAFRAEEPLGSWRESAQASALASGDISAFAVDVDWAQLAGHATTPEPQPRGASDRWYVSSREFGQGVLLTSEQVRAKFLGRVQPYSIYVPEGLDLSRPVALTWMLHSFATQHTQFEDKPETLRNLCDLRGSICITPLGRGPDGFNVTEAELDFWEVWNRTGTSIPIDWDRTAVWGYSMGAIGVYRMATAYPHVFARASLVAGGSGGGGIRPFPGGPDIGAPTTEVNTTPLLGNLRGVPIYIGQGALDELNPLTGSVDPPNELDRLRYRHRWELFPAEDHVVLALKDGFPTSAAYLGDARRTDPCPRQVTYDWYPTWDRPDLGVGTVGAYWIHDPVAARRASGLIASIDAESHVLAHGWADVQRSQGGEGAEPSPVLYREIRWGPDGKEMPVAPVITLGLTDVAGLTIDTACAGFRAGDHGSVVLTADAATAITLTGRERGAPIGLDGLPVGRADRTGRAVVAVPAGHHTITF